MRQGDLALLYHEMGRLLRSGLTLARTADALGSTRLPPGVREWVAELRSRSAAGEPFSSCLGRLPPLDRAVLSAAETSGHLDRVLTLLAGSHEAMDRVGRTILRRSIYPLFLLHFGALVLALPKALLGGGPGAFLAEASSMLAGVYLALFLGFTTARLLVAASRRSPIAERLVHSLPLAGPILWHLSVSRFCLAYGMQLEAGISVLRALPAAAEVSGSARIEAAARRALPRVERGESPLPMLGEELPGPVARGLAVGEATGTLDEELDRWASIHQEKALAGIETLGEWIPRLLHFAAVGLLAWKIVAAYQQVLSGYTRILDS